MLLARSSDQPARAAASGSIDWRAVIPAGSKAAAHARQHRQHRHVDRVRAERPGDQRDRGHRGAGQRVGDHRYPATPEVVDRGARRPAWRAAAAASSRRPRSTRRRRCLGAATPARETRRCEMPVTRARHQRGEQDQKCRAAACCRSWISRLNLTPNAVPEPPNFGVAAG